MSIPPPFLASLLACQSTGKNPLYFAKLAPAYEINVLMLNLLQDHVSLQCIQQCSDGGKKGCEERAQPRKKKASALEMGLYSACILPGGFFLNQAMQSQALCQRQGGLPFDHNFLPWMSKQHEQNRSRGRFVDVFCGEGGI